MANFEMEFELTGLKVKIKSERADAPNALGSVQQHIGNLLQSAAGLGAGEPSSARQTTPTNPPVIEGQSTPNSGSVKIKQNGRSGAGKRSSSGTAAPLDFSHDEQSYGSPKQSWNTAQKAMWLLYTLEKQTATKEADTGVIAATFNKYFKVFGPITTTNVSRDLGKARASKGYISSDGSKNPQTWYLLEAGKREVERLMQPAKGESPSA